MDGDDALGGARPARHAAEMPEDRRGVVALVHRLEAELARQQRVAAGGIDDEARAPDRCRAVAAARTHHRALALREGHLGHPRVLEGVGAAPAAVLEQKLIEGGAPDLVAVIGDEMAGGREEEQVRLVVTIGDEFRPRLEKADAVHLLGEAQPLEQRQVRRQQGFADVKARMLRLLQHDDVAPALRQQRRDGAAARPAADHQHVALAPGSVDPALGARRLIVRHLSLPRVEQQS